MHLSRGVSRAVMDDGPVSDVHVCPYRGAAK